MFNMISAELYKLRKSKSFWIMLAVVVGFSGFMSVIFGVMPAEDLMGLRPESASEMLIGALPSNIQPIIFVLVVFVVLLVNTDFDSGTHRNPLAVGVTRLEYFIAKFVAVVIACAVFVVAAVMTTGLVYLAFEPWGDMFNFGNFIASIGVGYLILLAQGTLFMAVALITRKLGATLGIVFGYLVLDMIVGTFIVMMEETSDVVRMLANILPGPAAYYLTGLATGIADTGKVIMVIVVSVVMIIVLSVVSVRSLVKRDV